MPENRERNTPKRKCGGRSACPLPPTSHDLSVPCCVHQPPPDQSRRRSNRVVATEAATFGFEIHGVVTARTGRFRVRGANISLFIYILNMIILSEEAHHVTRARLDKRAILCVNMSPLACLCAGAGVCEEMVCGDASDTANLPSTMPADGVLSRSSGS